MPKQALIVVDIQNDYFPTGKWPLVGVEAAADNAALLVAHFRAKGQPVIFVRHESTDPKAAFFVAGSEGAQLHAKVISEPGEPVVLKHFTNSFRETELQAILEQRAVDSLVVVGSMSHMCIDGVTRAATDFGYPVTLVHDACATRDLEFNGVSVPAAHVHAAFMAALAFGYATVVSAQEYLAE